jgi:hypothetical protein
MQGQHIYEIFLLMEYKYSILPGHLGPRWRRQEGLYQLLWYVFSASQEGSCTRDVPQTGIAVINDAFIRVRYSDHSGEKKLFLESNHPDLCKPTAMTIYDLHSSELFWKDGFGASLNSPDGLERFVATTLNCIHRAFTRVMDKPKLASWREFTTTPGDVAQLMPWKEDDANNYENKKTSWLEKVKKGSRPSKKSTREDQGGNNGGSGMRDDGNAKPGARGPSSGAPPKYDRAPDPSGPSGKSREYGGAVDSCAHDLLGEYGATKGDGAVNVERMKKWLNDCKSSRHMTASARSSIPLISAI